MIAVETDKALLGMVEQLVAMVSTRIRAGVVGASPPDLSMHKPRWASTKFAFELSQPF